MREREREREREGGREGGRERASERANAARRERGFKLNTPTAFVPFLVLLPHAVIVPGPVQG